MKTYRLNRTVIFMAVLLVFGLPGCDIIEKDQSPIAPEVNIQNIDMYLTASSAAVIDLKRVFPKFHSIKIDENLTNVRYFSDQYLKYKASGTNDDKFDFDVNLTDKSTISARVNVTNAGLSCDNKEAFTYAKISNGSRLVANLFNNFEFCDYDIYAPGYGLAISDGKPGIDVNQNSEGLLLAICSCGNEGDTAILTYTPPEGFVGQVKFKYYLGAFDSEKPYNSTDIYDNPDRFEFYSAHEVVIDVVAGNQ